MVWRSLSTLLDSPVKLDNHMVWDGKRFPFYEAYDIQLHHPKQFWSLWVRYALHYPSSNRHEAHASLASLFADQGGANVSLEQTFPLTEHDVMHADRFIIVGNASFSLAGAVGCVELNDQALRWDLSFEDPTYSTHMFPRFLYSLSFPHLKFLSPRFSGFVSGQVFVNHHSRDFQHLKVFQSHRYGLQNASPFAWAQCSDFEEDETAVLEVLTIERGWPRESKKMWSFFCLIYQGQKYFSNRLWDLGRGRSTFTSGEWLVEFERGGFRFECRLARGAQEKGLSVLAAIQIKIYKRQRGSWVENGLLTSKAGGVLEDCL